MTELQTKVLEFISHLEIAESEKQSLSNAALSGVTAELLEKLKNILVVHITAYNQTAANTTKALEEHLEKLQVQFEQDLKAISEEQKERFRKEEAQGLDDIRKQILS